MRIYHIAEPGAWAAKSDVYRTDDLESEGFIHCSTERQLAGVAESFYKDREDLVLLSIDSTAIGEALVYEDLYDMGENFPHVYGPIPVAAVVEATAFPSI